MNNGELKKLEDDLWDAANSLRAYGGIKASPYNTASKLISDFCEHGSCANSQAGNATACSSSTTMSASLWKDEELNKTSSKTGQKPKADLTPFP